MATGLLLDAVAIGTPNPVKGTAVVCVCVPRPGIEADRAMQALSAAVVSGLPRAATRPG